MVKTDFPRTRRSQVGVVFMSFSLSFLRPAFLGSAEFSAFFLFWGPGAVNPGYGSGQALEFSKLEFFRRWFRSQVVKEFTGLGPGNVPVRQSLDYDDALASAGQRNINPVARPDHPMRLAILAVDVDSTPLTGCLGLGPGLEQAGDVEPDIQAEGLHFIHL